jgi:pimeloyl-ACP methyl ester carboxylesterase
MLGWQSEKRDGTTLAWRDFGGDGPPVLLLHGLAGHAEEWTQTAAWLTERAHVVAPDARGHGRSERHPEDVSPAATADDAAFVLRQAELGPVVVVGQSLGGLTALTLTARHPKLVRGVVLIEASPNDPDDQRADELAAAVGNGLRSWPVPFASLDEAKAYFAGRYGGELVGAAWARGLERRANGYWPRFDAEVMVRTLRAAVGEARWPEWEGIRVPALVVRATGGSVDAAIAGEMLARLPGSRLVEIDSASHDVHLAEPQAWQQTLAAFLDGLAT